MIPAAVLVAIILAKWKNHLEPSGDCDLPSG
jgi:hypothetical protein